MAGTKKQIAAGGNGKKRKPPRSQLAAGGNGKKRTKKSTA